MSVTINGRNGPVTLLNPSEKGRKFADELKNGVKITNKGHLKMGKDSKPIRLTDTEKAYRSGYLSARKDSAKAYKAKHK